MQTIKMKSAGTNPKTFDNGVIGAVWPHYYYLTQAGWSHPFSSADECFSIASSIEEARKKAAEIAKKAKK